MNPMALTRNTLAVRSHDSQDGSIALGRMQARAILGAGSKSFALAGALLGRGVRDDAAVLYAWCRLADDLIDDAPEHAQAASLAQLNDQLDMVYGDGKTFPTPLLAAMHELVLRTGIPRAYPEALLEGFVMDANGHVYRTTSDLDLYAYRVAGVVGLMMCHVMGVRDDQCLKQAVHLGMAMQFTNICRDVEEDWRRGRLYLPKSLLRPGFALLPGDPLTPTGQEVFTPAAAALYERAELYYRSGAKGLRGLGWRSAVAIGAAMRIYRAIGRKIARRNHQVLLGRAVVSTPHKAVLLLFALTAGLFDLPRRWLENSTNGRKGTQSPKQRVRYEDAAIHS
jgi:15-cis-phytoene synthase